MTERRQGLLAKLGKIGDDAETDGSYPRRGAELLADHALLAPTVPAAYGGLDMPYADLAQWCHDLGATDTSARTLVTVQSMVAVALARWGTPSQRSQWLPALASGQQIAAIALTEPEAGSDLSAVTTRLAHSNGQWALSGIKIWVSMGHIADVLLVLATGDDGLITVLCPATSDGLTRVSRSSDLGMRGAALSDIHFDGCAVAPANWLGRAGFGLSCVAQTALDVGRLTVAAGCVGMIQTSLTSSVSYALQRRQFGKSLIEHQLIQRQVARLAVRHESALALVNHAAQAMDAGDPAARRLVWTAKYYAAEAAADAAQVAVDIHGSAGVASGAYPARLLRDASIMRLIEGSASVAELTIARLTLASMGHTTARRRTTQHTDDVRDGQR